MQSTTRQQIEFLTNLASGLQSGIFNAPTDEEIQTLRDAIDSLAALRLINIEEIKLFIQNNTGPVGGGEDAKQYLRIISSLDILIDTFRG